MKRYLLIDSLKLEATNPEDFTLYLKDPLDKALTKICLKAVTVTPSYNSTNCGYISIHCSMLTTDDNFINNEKSDVIAVAYSPYVRGKIGMNFPKLIHNTNCIRMYVTDCNNIQLKSGTISWAVYELEFT
jgi:hypothetical protein